MAKQDRPQYRYVLGDRDNHPRRFHASDSCPVVAGSTKTRYIGLMYARLPSHTPCPVCRPEVPPAPGGPERSEAPRAYPQADTELGRELLDELVRRRRRQNADAMDRADRAAGTGQSIRAVSGGLPGLGKRR